VFVQVSTLNAESSHQPLHPFAAHPDALAGQHGVDAWRAVAAARLLPATTASATARTDGTRLVRW